jgi:hypothetical protein
MELAWHLKHLKDPMCSVIDTLEVAYPLLILTTVYRFPLRVANNSRLCAGLPSHQPEPFKYPVSKQIASARGLHLQTFYPRLRINQGVVFK